MKKQTGFFFYYTTAAITIVLIGSVFFLTEPFNFALPLLFLPSFIFSWLKITNPQEATENSWSLRLLTIIAVLSALGLFAFQLESKSVKKIDAIKEENNQLITESVKSSEMVASMSGEIAMLKKEIEIKNIENEKKLDPETISDLLGTLDEEPQPKEDSVLGQIKVVSTDQINIFEKADIASRILGIADSTLKYDYFKKEDNWYFIQFTDNQKGWVKEDFVTEVN